MIYGAEILHVPYYLHMQKLEKSEMDEKKLIKDKAGDKNIWLLLYMYSTD